MYNNISTSFWISSQWYTVIAAIRKHFRIGRRSYMGCISVTANERLKQPADSKIHYATQCYRMGMFTLVEHYHNAPWSIVSTQGKAAR